MNFDDAIVAHVKWKVRLMQFVDGLSSEKFESANVCKDNLCTLGKWIYGEGSCYQSLPGYQVLAQEHAKFHHCAADVVKAVEVGDKAGAKAMVVNQLAAASRKTVVAIYDLRREVLAADERCESGSAISPIAAG